MAALNDTKCKNMNASFRCLSHFVVLIISLNCLLATVPNDNNNHEMPRTLPSTTETEILPWNRGKFELDIDDDDTYQRPEFPFLPGNGGRESHDSPPCFSVSRAHPLARKCARGACNVMFENELILNWENYDRKSGYFISRHPGLYFFTFSAISQSFSSFRLALFKNEAEIVSAYGAINGYHTAGNSIILSLQQNDKISLKLLEGELYESQRRFRAYTTFSGFLLSTCGHPESRPFEKPNRIPFPESVGGGIYPDAGPRSLPNSESYNSSDHETDFKTHHE